MKKYWQILRNYKVSLWLSPLLVLITVVCETAQPMFMARIVDEGVLTGNLSVVTRIGLYMVLTSVVSLIVSIMNVYTSSYASVGFATDLRRDIFSKIQQLSFTDIDRFSTSSLITRLTNDITKLQQVVLMGLRLLLRSPLMLVVALFCPPY